MLVVLCTNIIIAGSCVPCITEHFLRCLAQLWGLTLKLHCTLTKSSTLEVFRVALHKTAQKHKHIHIMCSINVRLLLGCFPLGKAVL